MTDAPLGLKIIVVLQILGAIALLFAGVAIAVLSNNASGFSGFFGIISIVLIIAATLDFIVAVALLHGVKIAWWIALIFGIGGIFALGGTSVGGGQTISIGGPLVDIMIVIYLLLPSTRKYFDISD